MNTCSFEGVLFLRASLVPQAVGARSVCFGYYLYFLLHASVLDTFCTFLGSIFVYGLTTKGAGVGVGVGCFLKKSFVD